MTAATRTFFWPNLEFLNVHVRRVGDAVTGDRRESTPRQCQPPPSTRTTRVHPLSLNLPCLPKPTLPIAVRRILQEAKELANDESTDYTAAPLEVCHISSPLPRQTFTHLIPGRHICESYPTPCPFQSNLYSKIQGMALHHPRSCRHRVRGRTIPFPHPTPLGISIPPSIYLDAHS